MNAVLNHAEPEYYVIGGKRFTDAELEQEIKKVFDKMKAMGEL